MIFIMDNLAVCIFHISPDGFSVGIDLYFAPVSIHQFVKNCLERNFGRVYVFRINNKVGFLLFDWQHSPDRFGRNSLFFLLRAYH